MTEDHARDIGRLDAQVEGAMSGVTSLFDSNEARKAEITGLKIDILAVQHAVDENNKLSKQVCRSMDDLKESMECIKDHVIKIDRRVLELESNKFDAVKVLTWFGSWRGTFFMISVVAMAIGAVSPEARDWLSHLTTFSMKVMK